MEYGRRGAECRRADASRIRHGETVRLAAPWGRGIVTAYSYDNNGALTNTDYSDGTPTISLAYNRAGQQIEAHAAAGVTTFLYDEFGSLTNETVIGVAGTNTIERYHDTFGRSLGVKLSRLSL